MAVAESTRFPHPQLPLILSSLFELGHDDELCLRAIVAHGSAATRWTEMYDTLLAVTLVPAAAPSESLDRAAAIASVVLPCIVSLDGRAAPWLRALSAALLSTVTSCLACDADRDASAAAASAIAVDVCTSLAAVLGTAVVDAPSSSGPSVVDPAVLEAAQECALAWCGAVATGLSSSGCTMMTLSSSSSSSSLSSSLSSLSSLSLSSCVSLTSSIHCPALRLSRWAMAPLAASLGSLATIVGHRLGGSTAAIAEIYPGALVWTVYATALRHRMAPDRQVCGEPLSADARKLLHRARAVVASGTDHGGLPRDAALQLAPALGAALAVLCVFRGSTGAKVADCGEVADLAALARMGGDAEVCSAIALAIATTTRRATAASVSPAAVVTLPLPSVSPAAQVDRLAGELALLRAEVGSAAFAKLTGFTLWASTLISAGPWRHSAAAIVDARERVVGNLIL
jgi:hypothetical protein